jgi:hypothetical protein
MRQSGVGKKSFAAVDRLPAISGGLFARLHG